VEGKVVGVSKDGKAVSLETAPPNARTGEGAARTDVRIGEQTDVVYNRVGLNGASPAEGYHARAWVRPGGESAARVEFTSGEAEPLVAPVVAVSADGKTVTLETPAVRGFEARRCDVKLTDQTKVSYGYVAKDAPRPAAGQR